MSILTPISFRLPYSRHARPMPYDFITVDCMGYEPRTSKPSLWAARESNFILNTGGSWEPEVRGSHKDPAYVARTRFASAEAAARAVVEFFEGEGRADH